MRVGLGSVGFAASTLWKRVGRRCAHIRHLVALEMARGQRAAVLAGLPPGPEHLEGDSGWWVPHREGRAGIGTRAELRTGLFQPARVTSTPACPSSDAGFSLLFPVGWSWGRGWVLSVAAAARWLQRSVSLGPGVSLEHGRGRSASPHQHGVTVCHPRAGRRVGANFGLAAESFHGSAHPRVASFLPGSHQPDSSRDCSLMSAPGTAAWLLGGDT